MAEVILITGGARSGKSSEALRLAEEFPRRVFIATAEPFDDEMRDRIARHQEERGPEWRTIEAPLDLADALRSVGDPEAAVVIDCLTVWLGNLMHRNEEMTDEAPPCTDLLNALTTAENKRIILVTNEIGMGIVPADALSRRFRDVAGRLNQRVAALADRVILTVCGLTMTIKPVPEGELKMSETREGKVYPCPRCGRTFLCRGDGDIEHCQCAAVELSSEDRAYIADRFEGCLCVDCLRVLAAERRQESGKNYE